MKDAKQAELNAITREIKARKVCPKLAESAKSLVMGEGSLDAEVMFIGEAPGKDEDEQGLPFVGRAGRLLNELLGEVGLSRPDVYITNIVKYRPPNNRDPLPDEIAAFMPYLARQVKLIGPKLIATLGRFSASVFLPQVRISRDHGQPKRVRIKEMGTRSKSKDEPTSTLVILPLYHPAAALYNGSMRQTLSDDFAKIPAILNLIKANKS